MEDNLRLHPDLRFDCRSCGRCCMDWEILLTSEEARKLRTYDWKSILPQTDIASCLEPERRGYRRIRMRPADGACPFLDPEDLRCRIHRKLGAAAKPFHCRLYPIHLHDAPGDTRATLRFSCPSVVEGHGRPLSELTGDILALRREQRNLSPPRARGLLLVPGVTARAAEIEPIENLFLAFYTDPTKTWRERYRAADLMAAVLGRQRLRRVGAANAAELARILAADLDLSETAEAPPLSWAEESLFRRFLRLIYLREYLGFRRHPFTRRLRLRLRHYRDSLRFLRLSGTVRIDGLGGAVPLPRVATLAPPPDDVAEGPLIRWAVSRLAGRMSVGLGFGLLEAIHLQTLAAAAALFFAKAHAAARGADTTQAQDLLKGILYVDDTLSGSRALATLSTRLYFRSLLQPGRADRILAAQTAAVTNPPSPEGAHP